MKKGKTKFTIHEEKDIKLLLSKLRKVLREEQKKIRRLLRTNFDFYISRFTSSKQGFSLGDYERLKKSGKIIIT